jgi:type I restriction enzyme S subunit
VVEIPLAELIRPAGRRAGDDTEVRVYSVTKHAGFVPSLEYFKKQVFSRDVQDYKLVEAGSFAYATIHLDEGSIGIAPERALISPMYTVFTVDQSRVEPSYLLRYLKSPHALAHYPQLGRGAIHRRKTISLQALGSLRVPLPALGEQRHIAAILDHADNLRAKRSQVLTHLDALAQSIFYDMFGEPQANRRHLPRVRIGSVADVVTGNSPSRTDSENFGGVIEWIKSNNLGGEIATVAEESLSSRGIAKARIAPAGSILVTCIAGSPTSIGKASMVDRDVAFNQQINAILPSPHLDQSFLLAQLKSAPQLVRMKSTGGMKGLVNKSAFQSIEILLPTLDSQRRFGSIMERLRVQRAATQRALAGLNDLTESLEYRAFRGGL